MKCKQIAEKTNLFDICGSYGCGHWLQYEFWGSETVATAKKWQSFHSTTVNNPLFIPHSYFNTSTIDLPHSEFSTIDVINPYMFCNVSIPNNFISSGSSGLLRNGNLICGGRGWMALAFNDSNFGN